MIRDFIHGFLNEANGVFIWWVCNDTPDAFWNDSFQVVHIGLNIEVSHPIISNVRCEGSEAALFHTTHDHSGPCCGFPNIRRHVLFHIEKRPDRFMRAEIGVQSAHLQG